MSSFTSLPSGNLSPTSTALLKVISFLDPDHIQEEILTKHLGKIEIQDYPKTIPEFLNARKELIESSKIWETEFWDLRTEKPIQDAVRDNLSPGEWIVVFNTVIALLSANWFFNSFEDRGLAERWATCEKYMPHCARVRDFWLNASKQSNDTLFATAILFTDIGCYMCEKAAPDEIELYAEASNVVLDNIKGNEDPESLHRIERFRIMNELGMATAAQGKGDGGIALEHAEIALNMTMAMASSNRWDQKTDPVLLANCYNNFGIAHNMLGQTQQSLEYWQNSFLHFRRRMGSSALDQTWPVVNTSLVYCYQGEPNKAAKELNPLYDALLETKGNSDKTSSKTGAIFRAMGHLRASEQEFGQALQFHQNALENLRATLGDTHPRTADCMYNVAQDLIHVERETDAIELLDEAIGVWGDNPRYERSAARALWQKGKILERHYPDRRPQEFIRRAMDIRKKVVPHELKREEDLKEADWTRLIYFYSR